MWQDYARCDGKDTEIFYPPRPQVEYFEHLNYAKAICTGQNGESLCPVIRECLLYALRRRERYGVWGGLSARERLALFRKSPSSFPSWITADDLVGLSPAGATEDDPVGSWTVLVDEAGHIFAWASGTVVDVAETPAPSHRRTTSLGDYQVRLVYQGELVAA